MSGLLLVALIAVTIILWRRIDALQERLAGVEVFTRFAPDSLPASTNAPAPSSADWSTFAEVEPAPEPQPVPTSFTPAPIPTRVPTSAALFEPQPVEEPQPAPFESPAPARHFGFEEIFGRYLPIWAGGVTLAVAGFLIVKYSIDLGLLSPTVRVIAGLLFGSGLIAGAEAALRRDDIARDPRIRQALSGAGIATLYASVLVAANLYHLIDPMTAFVGLAGVTVLAGLLSMRFGAPSAVLGLVGGLAAPAVVGSPDPNIPLLSTYLALTVGGLAVLGRSQRWWWLGALAVLGGFGWSLLLILSGLHDTASLLSVGTLTLLLSIGLPLLILGDQGKIFRLGAAVAGCAQMAAIVALGGFAPLDWALYGLISAAIIWLSRREALLADAPVIGLGVGAILASIWPLQQGDSLAIVMAVGGAIYGLPALWRLWRDDARLSDAIQIVLIAGGTVLIPIAHAAWDAPRADFAPLALLGMAIAGLAAILGWRNARRADDSRFAMLSLSAILLGLLAAGLVLPVWALAPAVAGASVVAMLLGQIADDVRIDRASLIIAIASIMVLVAFDPTELFRAGGQVAAVQPGASFVRWGLVALAASVFAWRGGEAEVRRAASGVVAAILYVALAQIVPTLWLALIPAAMLGLMAAADDRAPIPALAVAGTLSLGWAVQPLMIWLTGGAMSLAGMPFYVTGLPPLDMVAIRIAAPAAALIALLWRRPLPDWGREAGIVATVTLGTVTAHVAWKQVFALANWQHFVAWGMAERTLWEALLLGAAVLAWKLDAKRIATGVGLIGLLHFGWFTLAMHNPLWSDQAAGIWLVPAYAIGFALIWLSRWPVPDRIADRPRDAARMGLILLLAASLLRQIFHGSMLAEDGVLPEEDIARSLLAIGLAIGFLQWGIRRASRDWRIASLVLMLGAVGKVFVFDAAGLDGLLRIGSFAALGFSLIGVGWLYSRYLPDAEKSDSLTDESQPSDTYAAETRG